MNGKYYILEGNKDSFAIIPAEEKIVISNYYTFYTDTFLSAEGYYCSGQVSFIPKRGVKYFINPLQKSEMCYIQVLKEKSKYDLDLVPETSASVVQIGYECKYS